MQNKNIKISIIVPVYNVEQYLKRAIDSFLNQSFKDYEIILVNDGSIDRSKEICEEYTDNDERVKLINQENLGAHNARNNALKVAKGRYVCFFDSDDYIEPNMLEDLYDLACKYDSDLVISGFNINTYYSEDEYIVNKYIPYTKNGETIYNYNNKLSFRQDAYHNFDKNMFYPPWNKMYKLSYLRDNDIEFPITYRDDFPFVLKVIRDIENVTITKNTFYNFIRKRKDSETQKYVKNLYEKREEEQAFMIELYEHWGLIDDKDSYEMIARRYIDRLIECIVNLYNKECKLSHNKKLAEVKRYFSTDDFNSCIKYARPKSFYSKIMYLPLKLRSANLTLKMCKFINYIKTKNIRLFTRFKVER